MFSKKQLKFLIYLAYIVIALRFIPLILQWNTFSIKHLGSKYFFWFTAVSLTSDFISIFFNLFKIHTATLYNLNQLGEVYVATLLAIEIGGFTKQFRKILLSACVLQTLSTVFFMFQSNFDEPLEFNWGISKLYILAILFHSAVSFVRKSEWNNRLNPSPLIGLLGLFIFESLVFIPLISSQVQIFSHSPVRTYSIYFIFVVAGNLLKDACISYNAILNKKQNHT